MNKYTIFKFTRQISRAYIFLNIAQIYILFPKSIFLRGALCQVFGSHIKNSNNNYIKNNNNENKNSNNNNKNSNKIINNSNSYNKNNNYFQTRKWR